MNTFLPPAKEVWGKVICLQACVCPQGGTWAGTPPGTRYTPQTRYTPWDQVHPLGPGTLPLGPCTPPPGPGTLPWDQVHPPGTRYTLRDHVHPPGNRYTPWTRYTPQWTRYTPPPPNQVHHPPWQQCMPGDTGNKRAVRILLECILVVHKITFKRDPVY